MQFPLGRPIYAVVAQPSLQHLVANEDIAGANPAYCTILTAPSLGSLGSNPTSANRMRAEWSLAESCYYFHGLDS